MSWQDCLLFKAGKGARTEGGLGLEAIACCFQDPRKFPRLKVPLGR